MKRSDLYRWFNRALFGLWIAIALVVILSPDLPDSFTWLLMAMALITLFSTRDRKSDASSDDAERN